MMAANGGQHVLHINGKDFDSFSYSRPLTLAFSLHLNLQTFSAKGREISQRQRVVRAATFSRTAHMDSKKIPTDKIYN